MMKLQISEYRSQNGFYFTFRMPRGTSGTTGQRVFFCGHSQTFSTVKKLFLPLTAEVYNFSMIGPARYREVVSKLL